LSVPTFNPYYPTNAPTNLRVAYDIALEIPPQGYAIEVSHRYQFGLNIALPHRWNGNLRCKKLRQQCPLREWTINKNAVSAALGWTLPRPRPAATPGIATWTKPGNVPYQPVLRCLHYSMQFQASP
jgi:hypothetical protein